MNESPLFKTAAFCVQERGICVITREDQFRQMLEFPHLKGRTYFLAWVNIYTNKLFFSVAHQDCYRTTNLAENSVLLPNKAAHGDREADEQFRQNLFVLKAELED